MVDTVVIDCFPSSAAQYRKTHAIVAIDVIRATTMATTAVAAGRRCLVAADLDDAFALRERLGDALLAGELKGDLPPGFDLNNSPAALTRRDDVDRPLVMLSSSGTQLILAASGATGGTFVACLRNFRAVARHVAATQGPAAIIGAGSRGEFRQEDQVCCAWVAGLLVAEGYRAADAATSEVIERWRGAGAAACADGNSAAYLRRSGQLDDLDFVIAHVDDLDLVCTVVGNEICRLEESRS